MADHLVDANRSRATIERLTAASPLAPPPREHVPNRNHAVLFYEDDGVLRTRVGEFLAAGLAAGAPAIVIATPEHVRAFRDELAARGADVDGAVACGRLVFRDARETLVALMVGGKPDPKRFDEVVGNEVARMVATSSQPLRAYGEIVDLLCADGQADAAVALERLWNGLATRHTFSLFCAYVLDRFADGGRALFAQVCREHDHTDVEDFTAGRLRAVANVQQRAAAVDAHRLERQASDAFRLLVSSVLDYAIFILDPHGIVRTWNAGAERIKRWRTDEIVGRHFSVFYPPEDIAAGKCEMELEVAAAGGRFEDEGWRLRKDGTRFWANVVITAIHDEVGRLAGFAKVTRDLTERRRAEDERVRLARAEEANRVKDEFLAIFSHELRTPLNAILGWARLLEKQTKEPAVAKGLATIARNAETQARLVDDLLDITRIKTGKLELAPRLCELGTIVRDAVEAVRPTAEAKGLRFELAAAPAPVHLVGDAMRLQQVVWNVLTNAVKFTERGGSVLVAVEDDGARARMTVSDTGRGIDPSFLPHVFERFRQDDPSAARRAGGLGLGLAIVRHIVELHGGAVRAESAGRGLGATFTLTLPVRATDHETAAHARPTRQAVRLDGVKALVVEDDEDSRELLAMILEHAGARVEAVASAAAARERLAASRPDVVVSDVGMPGEDGYQLVRSVRALPRERGGDVAMVALTAYASEAERQRALDAGFDDHVTKPVDSALIVSVVRSVIARGRP